MSKSEIIFINLPPPIPSNKNIGKYVDLIIYENKSYKTRSDVNMLISEYIFFLISEIYLNRHVDMLSTIPTYNYDSIYSNLNDFINAIEYIKTYYTELNITNEEYILYLNMIKNTENVLAIKQFNIILNILDIFNNNHSCHTYNRLSIELNDKITTLFNIYKYINNTNDSYTIDTCMEYIMNNDNFKNIIQTLKAKITTLLSQDNSYLFYTIRNYAFKKYLLDISDYQNVSDDQYVILPHDINCKILKAVCTIINSQNNNDNIYNLYKTQIQCVFNNYQKSVDYGKNAINMYKNIMHNLKLDINKILESAVTLNIDSRAAIKTKLYTIIDSTKPK